MKKPAPRKQTKHKTQDLTDRAGGARVVADYLGITTQAVYGWGEYIPLLRVYQLKVGKPEWFK